MAERATSPARTPARAWFPLFLLISGCTIQVGEAASDRGAARVDPTQQETDPVQNLRIGQYNLREMTTKKLLDDNDEQVKAAAEVIARFDPDILSINELQYDIENLPTAGMPGAPASIAPGIADGPGQNARRLADRVTAVDPSLVFVDTLLTLGNSGFPWAGQAEAGPEFQLRGFGEWPGRFNIAVLSRYPIAHDEVRVIHDYRWQDVPGNQIAKLREETGIEVPEGFPVFEKALVLVPVETPKGRIWLVLLHPVSAGFSEMNPYRNFDELHALSLFLDGDLPGVDPLPEGAKFVVIGDLNADPEDGDSQPGATAQIYERTDVVAHFPTGHGGTNGQHPERNSFLSGCGKDDGTIVWNPATRLQLQLDYLLPSVTLGTPVDSAIFFPSRTTETDDYTLACRASDHRFVYIDLAPSDCN